MKVISRGFKNGKSTAMVIVNGQTKHLICQHGNTYTDSRGRVYQIG